MVLEQKWLGRMEDDKALDAALGVTDHDGGASTRNKNVAKNGNASLAAEESLREKQARLAMLRERLNLRKQRSVESPNHVKNLPSPKTEEDSGRKRLALKEKLRQKDAQLAMLRNRTMLRKRPLEVGEIETDALPSRENSGSVVTRGDDRTRTEVSEVGEHRVSDERKRHEDHIKRVKLMTAKKRQALLVYRSKFARHAREAAEAY